MDLSRQTFGTVIEMIYGNLWVRGVLALIAADFISGVALSFYNKEFKLASTADFLVSRALPYLLGGGTVQLVIKAAPPEWGVITDVAAGGVWTFVIMALAGHLFDNLKQMGLPIPEFMTAKKSPETKTTT